MRGSRDGVAPNISELSSPRWRGQRVGAEAKSAAEKPICNGNGDGVAPQQQGPTKSIPSGTQDHKNNNATTQEAATYADRPSKGSAVSMSLLRKVLKEPPYGWTVPAKNEGEAPQLSVPPVQVILRCWLENINVFRDRQKWLAFLCWHGQMVPLFGFFLSFFCYFVTPWRLLIWFLYAMVAMGTGGTLWLHRYVTHQAYTFPDTAWGRFWRLVAQNMVIKCVPEEIYAISHHVHHAMSEKPGDPYNACGGMVYCFFADANHQPISLELTEAEYEAVSGMLAHVPMYRNTYAQYKYWGSVSHPADMFARFYLNWAMHYAICYFLVPGGGHWLGVTLLAAAGFWTIGIRSFNFDSHGQGKDRHTDGVDFHKNDLSTNQFFPGTVSGEWHNNHHMFPRSANCGFLWWQLDIAFLLIRFMHLLGGVDSYRDDRRRFLAKIAKMKEEEEKKKKEKKEQPPPFDSTLIAWFAMTFIGAAGLINLLVCVFYYNMPKNWEALVDLVKQGGPAGRAGFEMVGSMLAFGLLVFEIAKGGEDGLMYQEWLRSRRGFSSHSSSGSGRVR